MKIYELMDSFINYLKERLVEEHGTAVLDTFDIIVDELEFKRINYDC